MLFAHHNCVPAEEFPQVQVLNPLDGFDWMIHRPFIQSGHFFKLVGVSSELDELQKHHHTQTDKEMVSYRVQAWLESKLEEWKSSNQPETTNFGSGHDGHTFFMALLLRAGINFLFSLNLKASTVIRGGKITQTRDIRWLYFVISKVILKIFKCNL